jgi:hypothetical protein
VSVDAALKGRSSTVVLAAGAACSIVCKTRKGAPCQFLEAREVRNLKRCGYGRAYSRCLLSVNLTSDTEEFCCWRRGWCSLDSRRALLGMDGRGRPSPRGLSFARWIAAVPVIRCPSHSLSQSFAVPVIRCPPSLAVPVIQGPAVNCRCIWSIKRSFGGSREFHSVEYVLQRERQEVR